MACYERLHFQKKTEQSRFVEEASTVSMEGSTNLHISFSIVWIATTLTISSQYKIYPPNYIYSNNPLVVSIL